MEPEENSEAAVMIEQEEPVSAIHRLPPTYPAACEDDPDYTVDAQLDLLTPAFFVHYTTSVRSWLCVGLCASFTASLVQGKYEIATLLSMKTVPIPNPQEAEEDVPSWVDEVFDPFEFILKIQLGSEDKSPVINITRDYCVRLFNFTHVISFPLRGEGKERIWTLEKLPSDLKIEDFAKVAS